MDERGTGVHRRRLAAITELHLHKVPLVKG